MRAALVVIVALTSPPVGSPQDAGAPDAYLGTWCPFGIAGNTWKRCEPVGDAWIDIRRDQVETPAVICAMTVASHGRASIGPITAQVRCGNFRRTWRIRWVGRDVIAIVVEK